MKKYSLCWLILLITSIVYAAAPTETFYQYVISKSQSDKAQLNKFKLLGIQNGLVVQHAYSSIKAIHIGAASASSPNTFSNGNFFKGYTNFSSVIASDVVAKGPSADVRSFMDGQSGRPTLAQWQANQSTVDVTTVLQAAIDSGLPIKVPSGTYLYTHIIIRDKTQLIGENARNVTFKAAVSSEPYSVTIDSNYIRNVRIENIWFVGNASNTGQTCWYFNGSKPALPAYQQGGIWYSTFKNIRIDTYNGYGIWLRGGTADFLTPNQFLTFENVVVFRQPLTTSRALLMTGQSGQVGFRNCEFSALHGSISQGINVEMSREFNNGGVIGGSTVGGSAVSDNAPINTTFDGGTSCQYSYQGFDIDRAQNVILTGMWFENLRYAISTHTASRNVVVSKNHFANAGSDGSNGGYLLQVGSTSHAIFENNDITGAYDTALISASSNGVIERNNYWATDPIVAHSSNLGVFISNFAGGTLALNSQPTVALSVAAGAANTTAITSNLGIGESCVIKVTGTNPLVLVTASVSGGNITTPFGAPYFTVLPNENFTVSRMDFTGISGAQYQITAASRRLSGPTSALPSLQVNEAGILYWDTTLGEMKVSYGTAYPGTWTSLLTTSKGMLKAGTTSGDSASAGNIGEYVSSAVAVGSAVTPTNGATTNVTSISLTAGDWDVDGNVNVNIVTGTITNMVGGISTTSSVRPTDGTEIYGPIYTTSASFTNGFATPRKRINVTGTTTVYLLVNCTYTGTAKAYGSITARRIR